MPDTMDPTIEMMRPRLLTLDQVRERLSTTEPLSEVTFEAQEGVAFRVDPAWDDRDQAITEGTAEVDAGVSFHPGGAVHALTKDALLEFGGKAGIPRKLLERTPAHLLEPQLNWWYTGHGPLKDKKLKAFTSRGGTVIALGSGTITPFSNLAILDQLIAGIQARYGGIPEGDILADYKFTHSLELTHGRLIVPGVLRDIDGPGTARPSDQWSTGVQWRNSQLGLRPTSVDGYLFRWTCTNGMTDTLVTSGTFNRRASGVEDDDVYGWARAAVDNVLGGLESSLDGVQATTGIPVESDVNMVLEDLFRQHSVPVSLRRQVIANMAETGGDLSMYSILNAITRAANDSHLAPPAVDKLLRTGGHVAHGDRCGQCRRVLPE